MGLDFNGADAHWSYGGFMRFRERLAKEIGVDLRQMEGFGGELLSWGPYEKDAIAPLLKHSDCDGELSPRECQAIAPRLRELIKSWPDDDYDKVQGLALADGMETCAADGTPLEFT